MTRSTLPRSTHRRALIAVAATAALLAGGGTATAAVDSASLVVDVKQRTISAILSDNAIRGVAPLDRSPLTRQWLHDGKAEYTVEGDKAEEFTGYVKIGYMVGYPATFNGRIKLGYTTPSFGFNVQNNIPGLGFNGSLIPTLTGELEVGFGPGVKMVEIASGKVTGKEGFIRIVNQVATVTGVVGTATIQPYVTVVSDSGDVVTTLGPVCEV